MARTYCIEVDPRLGRCPVLAFSRALVRFTNPPPNCLLDIRFH
jgi:hypothetical protein